MTNKPVNIKKVILLRTYAVFAVMCVFAAFIIAYLLKIQISEKEKWTQMAEELSTSIQTVEPNRGNIFATDGSLLATSLPIYDLRVDAKAPAFQNEELFNNEVDSLALLLSAEFGDRSIAGYKQLLLKLKKRKDRYYLLKRKVSFRQMKRVRNFPIFREGKYKGGLTVEERNRREKPFGYLAERTIGYSIKGVQPVGIEGAFNKELSGKPGKRVVQRISGGSWVPVNDDEYVEAHDGMDVVSTIDINLQDVATHALLRSLVANDAQWGTAILMEVKTGEVKAVANLSRVSEGMYEEKLNYAVAESCEPGSTFKLASLMAVLEEGSYTLNDTFDTENGEKRYAANAVMYDSEKGGHGVVSLKHAFEISSNVALSKAVYKTFKNSPSRYYDYLKKMGIHRELGIQLKGEGKPRIKHPKDKDWSGITLPWMSIGYEINVTPLQIAALYNAVANNGVLMKPLFVKQVQRTGTVIESYKPEVLITKICSEKTLAEVRAALEGVVENGTGKSLQNANYKVAGKTGTALVADGKAGYKNKIYRSSFAGYFPADNPQYTCFVMINAPSKGVYYGAAVAGPVFKEIADKVFSSSMHLHPELKDVIVQASTDLPTVKIARGQALHTIYNKLGITLHTDNGTPYLNSWIKTANTGSHIKAEYKSMNGKTMPDLSGMGLRDALYLLENLGIDVVSKGHGKVIYQSVPAGQNITKGLIVELKLG
jgi:cell division protein FtsI (penicillin-binding protein 3)